jgi:hypothetical protein
MEIEFQYLFGTFIVFCLMAIVIYALASKYFDREYEKKKAPEHAEHPKTAEILTEPEQLSKKYGVTLDKPEKVV